MIACLVIHGYTGGPHEVNPLAEYLAENTGWYIHVPTLPGHGDTLNLENVTYEQWLKAAEEAFLQLQKKYDSLYVIGFSMGGMIAAYLAAKHKVDRLVLLAPAGKYLSLKHIGSYIGDVISDGVKGKLNENEMYVHYKNKIGDVPLKANVEFVRLVKFTRQYLKEIDCPVLIVHGQRDGLVPAKTAYYLDKEIRSEHKEVVFFERSDHLICLGEDRHILNDIIYSFLEKEEATC
ncbi:alpha/beta hydrolase [Virgibacillus sp. W0430]|uniref:alpha/beta hydrolase n=1 Tax=Virgibacillus sp. W0430 TaxID=3391580 RepID=UPI003F46EF3A